VASRHEVKVEGKVLQYTARAGTLPILDAETEEAHGHIFFTSYTLPPGPTPRPLAFAWNGGPGSSSSLVHLRGFGPRVLRPGGAPSDNPGTWLGHTDLVFVDPVGTGYSRPTKPGYGPEFYQTRGDAESVAEFIRVYRNRFEAWDAPVFLAGESYGVTRAAGVADALQRRGIPVRGVILISLDLPLGRLTEDLRAALMLPTYTAAAFAHKRLPADLQGDLAGTLRKAETWALREYAPALAARANLSDAQRRDILTQLARYTGLRPGQIDEKALVVAMPEFTRRLLADRDLVVGRYDTRLAGPRDPDEEQYDPTRDPSLRGVINDVGVVRYFRNELGYRCDLLYQGPFGGGYPSAKSFRGDWMSVKWDRGPGKDLPGGPGHEQPLRRAMTANPRLKVFCASGYYDLACSYYGNAYLAGRPEAKLAANVVARGYAGGHAIYTDRDAQLQLSRDVAEFIRSAASQE
jgi:carboxypeptidase C (cathepsin A)